MLINTNNHDKYLCFVTYRYFIVQQRQDLIVERKLTVKDQKGKDWHSQPEPGECGPFFSPFDF